MDTITLGGKNLPAKADPLAQLYYRQEFGTDMLTDFTRILTGMLRAFPSYRGVSIESLDGIELDIADVTMESLGQAEMDVVGVLMLAWAMTKSGSFPDTWLSFESWISNFEPDAAFHVDFLAEALGVAARGLFPERAPKPVAFSMEVN